MSESHLCATIQSVPGPGSLLPDFRLTSQQICLRLVDFAVSASQPKSKSQQDFRQVPTQRLRQNPNLSKEFAEIHAQRAQPEASLSKDFWRSVLSQNQMKVWSSQRYVFYKLIDDTSSTLSQCPIWGQSDPHVPL